MKKSDHLDPFEQARLDDGVSDIDDQGDPVKMVLRLKDVRKCAHNWKTFSSEAVPGRIVVPSEVNIRDTRQIPFELDPPEHGAFREILNAWFKRPLQDEYRSKLQAHISQLIESALQQERIEAVHEFSLKLQSRALTLLMNTPAAEAETFISWGTHVFRSPDNPLDAGKAQALYDYIDQKIDESQAAPGQDLFSMLLAARIDNQALTREQIKGIIILTFAGGRDTVINIVTNTLAYLADHPESLQRLRAEPDIHNRAVEELIRYFSPLTHMGRVSTADTQVCEHAVKADSRISLCWASANRDASVFTNPNEVVLDRKLNPHVGFGFAHHNCLGATHARTIMQILIAELSQKISAIDFIDSKENIEQWGDFERKVGYHSLQLKFHAR